MAHPHSFSAWLRDRRSALGLTQAELGARVGCSAAAIRKFEAGQRRPSSQIAERLAVAIELIDADHPAFVALARRTVAVAATAAHIALALPATPFLGREHELEHLARLLARPDCRLLTLIGMGGVGKTSLALQVAAAQADTFADGVTLVSFAGVASGALVGAAIAAALGMAVYDTGDLQAQLIGYLRPRRLLLILDNCEHLLAEPGLHALVTALLLQTQQLSILAASREVLGLPGEWVVELGGLNTTDADAAAVALFAAHAQRVQAGQVLSTALRDNAAARQAIGRVLQIAEEAGFGSLILQVLTGGCGLLISSGQPELASELLGCVQRQPAIDRETSDAAQALLVRCEALVAPDSLAAALQRGQMLTLDQVIARLHLELAFMGGASPVTTDVADAYERG